MKKRVIETNRLILTPLAFKMNANTPELFAGWLNDPEVVKFSEQRHLKHTAFTQRVYWQKTINDDGVLYWFIHEKDGPIIGSITSRPDKINQVANLAVMIGDKSKWGRAYGLEAWAGVMAWSREHGIKKVEAGMMEGNWPMVRLAEDAGMLEEGFIPKHFIWQGKRVGLLLMGAML